MSDDDTLVPTSSMSFEKQVRVLRAYVALSEFGKNPVYYKEVMKAAEMARTQISGVNAFFVTLGFLEQTDKGTYIPTEPVVEFCRAGIGSEDYSILTPVLRDSALLRAIRNRILIHGNPTRDELIEFLLKESGESTRSRGERSLQWLEKAKIIATDEDGLVRLSR